MAYPVNAKKVQLEILRVLIIAAVFVGAFYLGGLAKESDFIIKSISRFGYWGVFVAAIIGGFNLAIPIPIISFLPVFLEVGLGFTRVLLVIAVGMTVADILAFYIGKSARRMAYFTANSSILTKLDSLKNRHKILPYLVLFLFAALAPFPNEAFVLPMGFVGYRLKNILLPLVAGNFMFNLIVAFGLINFL